MSKQLGIIVCKFGGSSITSPGDVKQIRRIINEDQSRKIIVVSAPGIGKEAKDIKVTDMLIELAQTRDLALAGRIIERYKRLCPERDFNDLSEMLNERMNQKLEDDAYLASLKAFGEEACAKLLSELLDVEYVDPKKLFVVSDKFDKAGILPESELMIKKRLTEMEKAVIVPGFYGYTKDGLIATFERNASDVTGAYIAASLDAICYEVFSDRIGVLAADPEIVGAPTKIEKLTYKEMRDLSYSGFSILHPDAIGPIAKSGVPVHIRSTSEYPKEGTEVVHDRKSDNDKPIVGIAYQKGFCSFNIEKFGLNEQIGIARKILQVFEKKKISIEFIPSAIDDISIILKQDQLKSKKAIEKIKQELCSILGEGTTVEFEDYIGCLVVAGQGLKGRRGISAEIQLTLANAGVNIKFISQGSKERCIVYGIESSDETKAVNAVYKKYFKPN